MSKIKLYLLFCALAGLTKPANAQNFDWLRTYGVSNSSYDAIAGICAEPNGGCVFKFSIDSGFISTSAPVDTLYFDKYKFTVTDDYANYLVRLDSNGKVVKVTKIGTIIGATEMSMDKEGNFYVTGVLNRTHSIGGVTMSRANGAIVYAKFDKDFNLIWAKQTGNTFNHGPQTFYYSQGHLYFIFSGHGNVSIGGKNYSFSQATSYVYGEINMADGKILWSDILYNNPSSTGNPQFVISEILKLKNKLYLSGYTFANVLVKGDTLFKGGFIVETDTTGSYKKRFSFTAKSDIYLWSMTTDGQHLYITGFFNDSLTWGKQKIIPEYPSAGYYQTRELFAASITTSLQPRWFFHPKVLDKNGIGSVGQKVRCSNGFLYFIGTIGAKILIDSTILSPSKYGKKEVIIYKSDSLGNILWAVSGGSTRNAEVSCIDALADKSVFVAGMFSGKITFGKFTDSSKNPSKTVDYQDSWLTKITDYSITRGQVKSGPYCTGDTIKIPYTKFGIFDSNNVFIAQLSDETGNFDKGVELGRLKSNKDGIIMGKLPSFQVVSSKLYRIRILSTNPKIQSYYRTDTLRLLIYSRDKANPGPPETICMGDSLKLNTYGGTKWTWSPKYRMDDSTKRQPIVWPIKNTTYKIIIGDSSGCGAPDTAFKKVIVRPALKSVLAFSDTTVCGDGALRVPYYFTGGDSVNYRFQWYFVSNPKLWFTMKSGQNLLRDTLTYTPSDPIEKLAIILKDGCTNKSDTAFLIISQRKQVTIKSTYRDTTLCTGNLLKYKATASGGVPKQYRYQWKDLVSNSVLSTTDSLKFLTKKTLKIQLIVNDGCEALGDTAEFEVKVKAELKAITNLRDTIICSGKTLNFSVSATGGTGKAYKFLWLLNGKQIDTTSSLTLTSSLTSTLTLITTDNCSANDTVKKTITVNPSPKADFSWDLACSRTVTKFNFTGTKPNSPITTIFHWNFNNESPSYLENPSYLFTIPGTKTLTLALTSSNGCTDTIKKDMVIKPQSKADFTATDVCETDSAVFINKSQDATGYNWKFGDGQNSKLQNPKHKFQISSTTTYNVTLVAQVTNGCSDSISKAITINKNPSSDFSYTYNGTKVDLKITKAGNSYQWKFGTTDSAKTTATTYTHTIKSSDQTKVCLTATDISGCSSQTCKNVSVGILKLLKSDGFKLYPNPNTGSFTIEIENPSKDVSIEIFNLLGKLVKTIETNSSKSIYEIDLNSASGMYWVRVKNGNSVWNQKVSIAK